MIESRELSVAGLVIIGLPVQAHNLDAVLTAIERSGWKARVGKPLNSSRGGNDRHHLANAALSLNAHQDLIVFKSDDGDICWAWRQFLVDQRPRRVSTKAPGRDRQIRRTPR
ncbi:MAG: hypothetical protein ACREHD_20945 [Pirellulales bacterium]